MAKGTLLTGIFFNNLTVAELFKEVTTRLQSPPLLHALCCSVASA